MTPTQYHALSARIYLVGFMVLLMGIPETHSVMAWCAVATFYHFLRALKPTENESSQEEPTP